MTAFKIVHILALATCLTAATAFANHNEPGMEGVERLKADAQQLNYIVQSSYLRYPVKAAVSRFTAEVNRLDSDCTLTTSSDHLGLLNHNDGEDLSYQLQRVQQSWSPVEKYLYDTYSDFPQVYRSYQQTRQDLYMLLGQDRFSTNESAPLNSN